MIREDLILLFAMYVVHDVRKSLQVEIEKYSTDDAPICLPYRSVFTNMLARDVTVDIIYNVYDARKSSS